MRSVLVYDWPVRVFHWLFAGLFVAAFAIANLVDDASAGFSMHMLAGLAMCVVLLLRLVWAVLGPGHARLSDLVLHPARLGAYFVGMFSGTRQRWVGHNPASSWAAVLMVCLGAGLGATGSLMAAGMQRTLLHHAHELMANAFVAVVLLHLGGLAAHALRHHDHLAASMVTGRKQALCTEQAAARPFPLVAVAFLGLSVAAMGYLLRNYDTQTRTLDLFGQTLRLSEGQPRQDSAAAPADRQETDHEHD